MDGNTRGNTPFKPHSGADTSGADTSIRGEALALPHPDISNNEASISEASISEASINDTISIDDIEIIIDTVKEEWVNIHKNAGENTYKEQYGVSPYGGLKGEYPPGIIPLAIEHIKNDKIEDDPTLELIVKCLEYSKLSYDDSIIHKRFERSIFNNVALYSERNDGNLFISIRGTVTMYDIANDINCLQVKMDEDEFAKENMYVHKGFYNDFREIKTYLREFFTNIKGVQYVIFTGHSRGSAISTFSSMYIKTLFPELTIYNIGFGCPRLGNGSFVNYYNKTMRENTFLFKSEFDIVTKLPIYQYYDIMDQYIIRDYKIVSKNTPDDSFSDMLHSSLEYHKIKYYSKCDFIYNYKA
jgi:hypothetical protein